MSSHSVGTFNENSFWLKTKKTTKRHRETFTFQREKYCETSLMVIKSKADVIIRRF